MCFTEIEDWYECRSRKKHRAFQNFIKQEMNKLKIYSLPTYDINTDTYKDGPLPKDVDVYFNKDKSQQTYYSWEQEKGRVDDAEWLFKFNNKDNDIKCLS